MFVAQRPWLPHRGSCHGAAVTERALSAPIGGTSPIGRGNGLTDKRQFVDLSGEPDTHIFQTHRMEHNGERQNGSVSCGKILALGVRYCPDAPCSGYQTACTK